MLILPLQGAFNGAYLGATMANMPVAQAVALAAQVAVFVIQHPGAIVPETEFNKHFYLA
ncbi:MAG: hypothetical protein ACSHW0_01815 [Thalassotalea sp.]